VSTIADNWILLTYVDRHGERNRALSVIKARGSTHSNQTREFLIGPGGCSLADVYTAGGDVVMGTARLEREARHRAANKAQIDEHQKRRAALTLRAREIQSTLGKMAAEGEAIEQEILNLAQLEENRVIEEQKMLQDVRASRLADL
jgi:circadian clock protein KaiC